MRLLAMRIATALVAAPAVLALAACGASTPPTPTPPTADVTVNYPLDKQGIFFMAPGQTLLLTAAGGGGADKSVLVVAGNYAKATLFKAVGVGRTTVGASERTTCNIECNPPQPVRITVVVVSDTELQQGVVISDQEQSPLVIHLRTGQPFVMTLRNPPAGPPWARVTSTNQTIIVPLQTAVTSADGIEERFRADQPGRVGVYAVGRGCASGACPGSPYIGFTFLVFA